MAQSRNSLTEGFQFAPASAGYGLDSTAFARPAITNIYPSYMFENRSLSGLRVEGHNFNFANTVSIRGLSGDLLGVFVSAAEGTFEKPLKKIDFYSQEMVREANTMNSKAGIIEIKNRVVDLKSCIEKVKEHAQNIE